jgi:PEP-CTERM motif
MTRLNLAIFAGLAGTLAANAGQIQIGGANGITSAYITNPTGNGCGTCLAGSLGNWKERSYEVALFEMATTSGATTLSNGSHTGSALIPTVDSVAPGLNSTMTDNNNGAVTFNLLNDGVGTAANGNTGLTNNFWGSTNGTGGAGTLTIPIGIFGVDKTWLMLNDYWSYAGSNPTIQFNFSSRSATDASPDLTDVLTLTASSTGYRSALDCAAVTGTGVTCPASTANGAVIAGVPITSAPTGVLTGDATTSTSTIWDANYVTAANPLALIGPYHTATGNSSGTLVLDDTLFNFGTKYNNDYLVSISFTSALPTTANTNNLTRLALSGITVDQVPTPTPEPSTLALLFSGLGLLGFARFRRRLN